MNVQRLKEYKERLVVFPRRNNKVKNGDATKAEIAASTLDTTSVNTLPKASDAVTFAPITEVLSFTFPDYFINVTPCYDFLDARTDKKYTVDTLLIQELKSFKAYSSLRAARADSRLVGIRAKKQKEGKEDAPAAAAAQE